MFSGSLVAIVTPMRPDGVIDLEAWTHLIELHLASGTNGIVVGGSTGESATLEDDELRTLTQRACEIVRRRIPVIAGAGTPSTALTVARARSLSELPVDGFLVVTPGYTRPTQEGLYQHFAAVAAASSKPLMLYNVPSRTGVDLLPPTVVRLAQLSRIVGIKEAVAGARIAELKAVCPGDFVILSGDDASARAAILAGAQGVISVTANAAPRLMAEMVAKALAGDHRAAEALDARLAALHRDLFVESNPIPVKWALAQQGLIGEGIRLPLTPLSPASHGVVRAALQAAQDTRPG